MLISEQIEKQIINGMDAVLSVVRFGAVVNNLQEVEFKCIKWLKLYGYINSDTQVESYNGNVVTFVIDTPSKEITKETVVELKKPLFLAGTLSNTKQEWNRFELDEKMKLPFIWLVSPTSQGENQAGTVKTASLVLWFVHWSNWQKLNKDRQDEAIKPLMALMGAFFKSIDELSYLFPAYSNKKFKDFPKFGTMDKSGVEKMVFDSTLSAVEVSVDLDAFVNCGANC